MKLGENPSGEMLAAQRAAPSICPDEYSGASAWMRWRRFRCRCRAIYMLRFGPLYYLVGFELFLGLVSDFGFRFRFGFRVQVLFFFSVCIRFRFRVWGLDFSFGFRFRNWISVVFLELWGQKSGSEFVFGNPVSVWVRFRFGFGVGVGVVLSFDSVRFRFRVLFLLL